MVAYSSIIAILNGSTSHTILKVATETEFILYFTITKQI